MVAAAAWDEAAALGEPWASEWVAE